MPVGAIQQINYAGTYVGAMCTSGIVPHENYYFYAGCHAEAEALFLFSAPKKV